MTTKRILIVHDDRHLTNLYREKLEGSGLGVDVAKTLAQSRDIIAVHVPDVILLDLVLVEGSGVDFIKALRCEPNTQNVPIVVFPNCLVEMSAEAMHAGATKIVAKSANPLAATLDTIKVAAGLPGLGASADAPLFKPDAPWLKMMMDSVLETVNQMRQCLPGLVTQPPDYRMLRSLWSNVHAFAAQTEFFEHKALFKLANTFDLLLAELNALPEQINTSTLRTLGQAIDFLAVLSDAPTLARTEPSAAGKVLIVDDEEGARQFITAAMQLAGLSSDAVESPSKALETLQGGHRDLIFLDIGMPEMNGFDLCAKIRTLEPHEKTPVVFLTGMVTFQNKAQASLSGGVDFVAKPFILPELALKALVWIFRGHLSHR